MKTTIAELIEAAEKNGWEWKNDPRTHDPSSFCVLEQAALNLGAEASAWAPISTALDNLDLSKTLGTDIWDFNDSIAGSYEESLNNMKEVLKGYEDKSIKFKKK